MHKITKNSLNFLDFTEEDLEKIKDLAKKNWEFDQLPGNNPSKWPENLDNFLEQLQNQKEYGLFFLINEPDYNQTEFFQKARKQLQH